MRIEHINQSAETVTRVLVMSADSHLGGILNFIMQDRGFSTTPSLTIQQGIEFLEHEKPEILILDENLPGALGTDVLQTIMIQYPEVPVIFLTNDPHSNAAIEAILLGAYGVVAKPVEVTQLGVILVGAKARKAQHKPLAVSDYSVAPGCAA